MTNLSVAEAFLAPSVVSLIDFRLSLHLGVVTGVPVGDSPGNVDVLLLGELLTCLLHLPCDTGAESHAAEHVPTILLPVRKGEALFRPRVEDAASCLAGFVRLFDFAGRRCGILVQRRYGY